MPDTPAPIVSDEAIEAVARVLACAAKSRAFDPDRIAEPTYEVVRKLFRDDAHAALTAAAPHILAVNQPTPSPDLTAGIAGILARHVPGADEPDNDGARDWISEASVDLEAYVAAQVAAARADERGTDRIDGYLSHIEAAAGYSTWVGIFRHAIRDAIEAMNDGDVQSADRGLSEVEAAYQKQNLARREAHRPAMNAAGLDYTADGRVVALRQDPA